MSMKSRNHFSRTSNLKITIIFLELECWDTVNFSFKKNHISLKFRKRSRNLSICSSLFFVTVHWWLSLLFQWLCAVSMVSFYYALVNTCLGTANLAHCVLVRRNILDCVEQAAIRQKVCNNGQCCEGEIRLEVRHNWTMGITWIEVFRTWFGWMGMFWSDELQTWLVAKS
jgi:hypothetical protein